MVLVGVKVGLYVGILITNPPRCQEDAVLVGVGDFNRGRWTSYECGPAVDDFAPTPLKSLPMTGSFAVPCYTLPNGYTRKRRR